MKKLLSLLICVVMLLTIFTAAVPTVHADGEGEWDTFRRADDYDSPDYAHPAPGYRYTSEGFQTVPSSCRFTTPAFSVVTKTPRDVKQGIHLEFRVDHLAARDDDGFSAGWIVVTLWNRQKLAFGSTEFGGGPAFQINPIEGGSASVVTYLTEPRTEESRGSFGISGRRDITVPLESEDYVEDDDWYGEYSDLGGRAFYTFDLEWTGEHYAARINGVEVPGMEKVDAMLQELMPDGMMYVGITMESKVQDQSAGLTILNFNGTVPSGTDFKEADKNPKDALDDDPYVYPGPDCPDLWYPYPRHFGAPSEPPFFGTQSQTKASDAENGEEQVGCGSVLGGAAGVLITAVAAAALSVGRRETERD